MRAEGKVMQAAAKRLQTDKMPLLRSTCFSKCLNIQEEILNV